MNRKLGEIAISLFDQFIQSLALLFSSSEIWTIAGLSFLVSATAVLLSTAVGIPVGMFLSRKNYRGKTLISVIINTGMGLPPVLVGLVVFLLFARTGPLGDIRILFTPLAMILAQFILTLPIIIGVTKSTISDLPENIEEVIRSMGADETQIRYQILIEGRMGILTGIVLALGRAFSEVGAIMIVGGNIRYKTRVLTTAIITEISRGENETALALGLVLIIISMILTSFLTLVQK